MSSNARQPIALNGYQPYEHQGKIELRVVYNRKWHLIKVVIRAFDLLFCLIVIAVSLYAASITSPTITLFVCTIPAAIGLMWDTAEMITICARGGRKGIHPGGHVGMHLLVWLYFAVGAGISGVTVALRDYTEGSWRLLIFKSDVTVFVFTILLVITNFTLFVRACCETHHRNRRPPVFMVPANTPATQMVPGSYVPYPHQPTDQSANMEAYTPPGPDGSYYAPGQAR